MLHPQKSKRLKRSVVSRARPGRCKAKPSKSALRYERLLTVMRESTFREASQKKDYDVEWGDQSEQD